MTRISRREATLGLAGAAGALVAGEAAAGHAPLEQPFDLVIRGGEVLDPSQDLRGRCDVAIRGGRIAAVAAHIPSTGARATVSAAGRLVVPGLVDLVAHVAPRTRAPLEGADPRGRTTTVSAGDFGVRDAPSLRRLVGRRTDTRLLAFLSIAGTGPDGTPSAGLYNVDLAAIDMAADVLARHADIVIGLDVRLSDNVVARHGVEPLARSIRACEQAGTQARILCHVGSIEAEDIASRALDMLRPGDVLADGYGRSPVFAGRRGGIIRDGRILPAVLAARRRGVALAFADGGMLDDAIAARAIAEGAAPDVVASAGHVDAPGVPGLTHVMSRMLGLGSSLGQVVAMATIGPARIIGRDPLHGTLRPGAPADLTLLRQREMLDLTGRRVVRLEPAGTVLAGRTLDRS